MTNDYPPEVYALIEDNHPSGYSIVADPDRSVDCWSLVFQGQIVRSNRTLEQCLDDVERYQRLTESLSS